MYIQATFKGPLEAGLPLLGWSCKRCPGLLSLVRPHHALLVSTQVSYPTAWALQLPGRLRDPLRVSLTLRATPVPLWLLIPHARLLRSLPKVLSHSCNRSWYRALPKEELKTKPGFVNTAFKLNREMSTSECVSWHCFEMPFMRAPSLVCGNSLLQKFGHWARLLGTDDGKLTARGFLGSTPVGLEAAAPQNSPQLPRRLGSLLRPKLPSCGIYSPVLTDNSAGSRNAPSFPL